MSSEMPITRRLSYLVVSGDCVDGVDLDNYCYRLPYRAGPRISYQEASDLCQFHGGVLARIHSEEVYLAVFRYIKRSWYYESSVGYVQVWMGAEYNVSLFTLLCMLKLNHPNNAVACIYNIVD